MLPRARGPRRAGPRAESACIAQARQLAVSENAGLLFHPSGSVVQARARPALRRPPAGRRTHQHALRAGQGACLGSVSRGALDSARAAGRGGGGGGGGGAVHRAPGAARPAGPGSTIARHGYIARRTHPRAGTRPGCPRPGAASAPARHAAPRARSQPPCSAPIAAGAASAVRAAGARPAHGRAAAPRPAPRMQRSCGTRDGGGARSRCWTWQRASCGACCGATWTPSAASATTPACRRARARRSARAPQPRPSRARRALTVCPHVRSSAGMRAAGMSAGRTPALVLLPMAACLRSAPLCASRCLRPWAVQGPRAAGAGPPEGPMWPNYGVLP